MNTIVDMHTHIMYGVDDGALTPEETMIMIEDAVNTGTNIIWLTPHFSNKYNLDMADVKKKYYEIRKMCKERFENVEIFLGGEILYEQDVVDKLIAKKIPTMDGSRYVLIEFDSVERFEQMRQGIIEVIAAGFIPIVAHVERYKAVLFKEQKVLELVEIGAYIQVNGDSFIGGIFDKSTRWCRKIFDMGLVHFLGSDAHNSKDRVAVIKPCIDKLKKHCKDKNLCERLYQNHKAVIEDSYI